MPQYFNGDFADFPAAWTERYNPPATGAWAVAGGNLVMPSGKSGDWCMRSWAPVDADENRDQVEILVQLQLATNVATASYPLVVRASGVDEAPSLYCLQLTPAVGRLRWYRSVGADGPVDAGPASADKGALAASAVIWIRARVNGRSPGAVTLQAKFWAGAIGDEPAAWDVSSTDTAPVYGVGWVGLGMFGVGGHNAHSVLQLGVGTNGDAAPSSAPLPPELTGNLQLDEAAPSGAIDSNPPATLTGGITLDPAVATGSISTGGAPGTVLLAGWRNLSGMPLPSQPVARITLQRLSDGVQVLNLAGLTTSSDALNPSISITNAALVPATQYLAIANSADGSQLGVELVQAT